MLVLGDGESTGGSEPRRPEAAAPHPLDSLLFSFGRLTFHFLLTLCKHLEERLFFSSPVPYY